MGVRRNIDFLDSTAQENFVKACVLMKEDIVNPGAPAAEQYSRWDENVALHLMIQNGFAPIEGSTPASSFVNFGHGGNGSFSFLSWHRYFLFYVEQQLQSYVPGVMIPYWDWTDPAPSMTDTFLGPNGSGGVVPRGYFAFDKPGAGSNPTSLPLWWPPSLVGWRLPAAFGATWVGGLRRNLRPVSQLPTVTDLQETLAMSNYRDFQNALESGQGLSSFGTQFMHNGMHGWIGGHMGNPTASPFDPFFYLHHCNIDRLWAMWQLDGHADLYPTSGGANHHHRNDRMYPWVGAATGYGTNEGIAASIPMPNVSALGEQKNVDTLDFRSKYGYTYDTLPIIGIGLDRTGSMNGMTPDPMTSGAPDVTKWEAAKRGVSAFLQDCETVQNSGVTYVQAGIKTFRRLVSNDFASVFAAPNSGLVKAGTGFSKAAFDANIAAMAPGGSTPLADALQDVQDTLVESPFASVPVDEQRYLAMLTDGLLTAGAPLASIADGAFARTAVFAMGFGTGAEVDYATLANLVAKGRTLDSQQVFHGENAGTIDKFYTNALAGAIGFTTIFDPVVELFAGEHTHIEFYATSAEDVLLITAQGMDFTDVNWTFHLHGPSGQMLYGDTDHQHNHGCQHCCVGPHVTTCQSNGRLTLVLQRGTACRDCWVGQWTFMVAYKARHLDAMMMPVLGEWLFPISAGPVRGPRYARLQQKPAERIAKRNLPRKPLHGLDEVPLSTNHNHEAACEALVNIYARTRLRLLLHSDRVLSPGAEINVKLNAGLFAGKVLTSRAFARLVAPSIDLAATFAGLQQANLPQEARLEGSHALAFDPALVLASLEKTLPPLVDKETKLVSHHGGPLHLHEKDTAIAGLYHLGIYLEGVYFPEQAQPDHQHHSPEGEKQYVPGERFNRLLNLTVAVTPHG